MPSILLVDNYYSPEKIVTLRDSLVSAGAAVTVVGRADAKSRMFNDHDGVVLSGSPAMLSEPRAAEAFAQESRAIEESSSPVLGICFGQQLMGFTYGSRVVRAPKPTKRYVETKVLAKDDEVFSGLPAKIKVYESHHEIVEAFPRGFRLLATSPTSPIAAFRHEKRPLLGVQFHPEKNSSASPDGRVFIENFVGSLG